MALIVLLMPPGIAEAEDPVVVRVGEVAFTKSQVQSAIDSDITLLEALEQPALTEEEKQAQRDNTIERFIGVGLIEMKLREAGKNDFTKEEEENLKAAARNQYEQLWQGLWQRAQDSSEEFTEDQITEFMEDEGYTSEAIYEEYKNTERRYRVLDIYCPNLILTEDMDGLIINPESDNVLIPRPSLLRYSLGFEKYANDERLSEAMFYIFRIQ